MKANTVVSGPRLARVILVTLIAVSAIAVSDSFHPPEVEAARTTTSLPSTDLFISEYIEGSGAGNKAIEIYNGTLLPVDMAAGNYVLQLYSNGAAIPSQSFNLDGTIAVGDVYVISRNDAAPAILAQIDLAAPGVINFNGDDAVVLRKGGAAGAILDAIGQVGTDPGTEWGTGLTSTVTRCSVLRPDLSPITSRAIETGLERVIPVRTETAAPVSHQPPMVFTEKKSLPRLVISGIPRARAETTTLPSTSNCIGFGDVQRGRTCPRLGAVQLGWR